MSMILEAHEQATDLSALRPVLAALAHWAAAPEDPMRILVPSGRPDALGVIEVEVAAAQKKVREDIERQRHLAEIGLAVSKINHDLKGLLAAARLLADRLVDARDPVLRHGAGRLQAVIDRAIGYTDGVLAHGRACPPEPERREIRLYRVVAEAGDLAGLAGHKGIAWHNEVPSDIEIDADPDQLFRVFLNLLRNAVQALDGSATGMSPGVSVAARRIGRTVRIRVADNGPGLPARARMNLFRPFHGAARPGGAGLGLPIAAEIVRAHGGTIRALRDGPGTVFMIEIPDRGLDGRPAQAGEAGSLRRKVLAAE